MSTDIDTDWVGVALRSELESGGMLAVDAGDKSIAIYDVKGEIFATDNECTHAMAYLTDGTLEGDVVECPLHGGKFSVRTGEGLCAPITCALHVHKVRVVDNEIQLKLPDLF